MAEAPNRADTQPRRPGAVSLPARPPLPWAAALIVAAVAATAAIVVISALALLLIANTHTVTVIVAGEATLTRTDADTVGELLARLTIAIGPNDRVTPPVEAPLQANTIIRVDRARTVFLQVDGDTRPHITLLENPADILAEADVQLAEYDQVIIDGTTISLESLPAWPVPVAHIAVRHAVALRVIDGSDERLIQTNALTVGEALFAAGITLYAADTVTPAPETPLTADAEAIITRARPVTLTADGRTVQLRARGATVADALAEAGITLDGLDYAVPDAAQALRPGIAVRVIRVSETVEIAEVPIAFETRYEANAEMELDSFRTASAGAPGVLQQRQRVLLENGIVVARTPLDDVVAQAPQPRVIQYGTRIVLRTIDTGAGPREYWRVLPMWATSYHPAALGGDNITSTGRMLQKGIVGGDPRILPYGTQIYVEGYGVGEIADTGPPQRRRLWIDLGYSDADWVGWARTVDAYILAPPPTTIDYLLMAP